MVRARRSCRTAPSLCTATCVIRIRFGPHCGRGREIRDAPIFTACNDVGTAVLVAQMAEAGLSRLILASSVVLYGELHYTCAAHGHVVPGPRAPVDLDAGRFDPLCPQCGRPLAPQAVDETAPTDPRNVYALTKLAQEHLVQVWARETGGTAVALRYHSVYGAGMPLNSPYSGIASTFRSSVEHGQAPEVFEDGRPMRDFIDVRDVAAANAAALRFDRPGFRAFNVGTGVPHTIKDLADALVAATGGPPPVVSGRYRLGDVRHIVASPRRIMAELGWKAAIEFADGIREFAVAPLRATPSGVE
jgi:dTDP-L-rhamnose 4-epimerase